MAPADRRRRWSIDLQEEATLVEQAGGAALVLAALVLAGLGIARIAGSRPDGALFVAALAVAGAGVVVLAVSFGSSMARRARQPVWTGRADSATPGVLLLVAEAEGGRDDPAAVVRRLGPVRCRVGSGTSEGEWASVHGPRVAADGSIARIGGALMTRYHPAFFPGAAEPWSGTYEYRWEVLRPDGSWQLLVGGTAEVVYTPLVDGAPADDALAQP